MTAPPIEPRLTPADDEPGEQLAARFEKPEGSEAEFRAAEPIDRLDDERVADAQQDRKLRVRFMYWMLGILIGQLYVVNVGVIALAAFAIIDVEEWTLRIWIGGTLLEVFGVVLVIAKYLFPSEGTGRNKRGRRGGRLRAARRAR